MAPTVTINYIAVLVAAIVNMVLGFLWYGPLFGKQWIQMMNFDKKKMAEAKRKGMGKTYAVAFISTKSAIRNGSTNGTTCRTFRKHA